MQRSRWRFLFNFWPINIWLCASIVLGMVSGMRAWAHDAPYSYVELRLSETEGHVTVKTTVEVTAIDAAHDLETVTPEQLMEESVLRRIAPQLAALLERRLVVLVDGSPISFHLIACTLVREKQNVRLEMGASIDRIPRVLVVQGQLFPYDPRHKTFLTLYKNDRLNRQFVLEPGNYIRTLELQQEQGLFAVVWQFVGEGIHHIYLGPDHILFITGLVLLPASLKHLLKIATAFTIAHSITLVIATLKIFNPPSRLIEPTIAFSIVVVGVHALMKEWRMRKQSVVQNANRDADKKWFSDTRLLFAFGFGLIHGFGFASALQEMELPRYALGWSLFAFNVGVEIGQVCIILLVAPMLILLRRYQPRHAWQVVCAGSVAVVIAGVIWLIQRLMA